MKIISEMTLDELREEIKRVNAILRKTINPHEYKQNKKYLERLNRRYEFLRRQN